MEQGRHSNSDSSSSENDPQLEKSKEDNSGVGRSYKCTYCKRGFTNAQALGGHMNIHRKDKAKTKQRVNKEESSIQNLKTHENYANSRVFPQITHLGHHHHQQHQQQSYYTLVGTQVNYQVYLPSPNPNFQIGSSESSDHPIWRPPEHFDQRHHSDENLTLRIGLTPPSVDEDGDGKEKEDEVDLELRLGHDP